ncbi:MAG TPA: beta-ketoacyl-[acyl-carrier-protein] synthase family protein [Candidatus Ozemobacteraceae bacterium]|nr:beta-ketoacyl-[acyl-carrier-protein] synthase family protein [Candidatus Ozemobacteraceae bacterium]
MSRARVVMTGVGVICACGHDGDSFWNALSRGESGLRAIRRFDTSTLVTKVGGEVDLTSLDKPPCTVRSPIEDTKAYLAWNALQQILHLVQKEDALITTVGLERIDLATIVGADTETATSPVCPETPPVVLPARLWGAAGVRGPVATQVAACAAGTLAIGHAFRLIRSGWATGVVAGGVDSLLFPFGIHAFNSIGALSEQNERGAAALAPFDRFRSGTLLGEGAGYVMLEELDRAIRLGHTPLAEILGFGGSMDAYHPVMPCPNGLGASLAMRRALDDARLAPERIQYINAHGTGTWHNDVMEAKAILQVFGDRGRRVPVSSTKPFFGHLLTAAGAVECISALLPLTRGLLPPTLHWRNPDPDIPLDCIPETARPDSEIDVVMSNSYGLGGQNASLVFGRWHP